MMRRDYLPSVVKAKYVADYVLCIDFDDGVRKLVDISQWFRGPVFEPLQNKSYFKKFFIEGATIAWPNGADISPESLYEAPDLNDRKVNHSKRAPRRPARING